MHIPWIEHWDFLDSYVDLSTAEGLDTLEEYFKKTTWHRFIKDYKDLHGLEELYQDFNTGLNTPVKAESCDKIESAENFGRDILKSDQKSNDGFEKDMNISRDLSKVFDSCESDTKDDVKQQKDENNGSAGDPAVDGDSIDASKSAMSAVFINQNGAKTDCIQSTRDDPKTADPNTDADSPQRTNVGQSANAIVSPMTSLSQSFAQLTVMDESWDDKMNNNSSDSEDGCDSDETSTVNKNDKQIINSGNYDNQAGDKENNVDVGKENRENESDADAENADIVEKNRRNVEEKKPDCTNSEEECKTDISQNDARADLINAAEKDNQVPNADIKGTAEKKENITGEQLVCEIDGNVGSIVNDCVTGNPDPKADTKDKTVKFANEDGNQPASQDNQNTAVDRKRLLSERSDSTGSLSSLSSYQTAASEEFYDCNASSPFSDTTVVGIRLMYKPILDALKDEIDMRKEQFSKLELETEPVFMLVRLKSSPNSSLKFDMKVDIVVYPTNDSSNELVIFENLEVKFCEGDLSGVVEGEVIEVCFTQRLVEVKLRAHFTREENLPQPLYIHG